jgi:parallel beta-helix repeat protein
MQTELSNEDGWEILPSIDRSSGTYIIEELTKPIQINRDYSLCTDLNVSGQYLFRIIASNVVLDLNGHTISNKREPAAGYAIDVEDKDNVTIRNGVITHFQYGIVITRCGLHNGQVNIFNITVTHTNDYAMKIDQSGNVRVWNCSCKYNEMECISLINSSFSEVSNNTLSNNKNYGIELKSSGPNNTISYNTISDNLYSGGIIIALSSNNTIFNNNFSNNTDTTQRRKHVYMTDNTSINVWNLSYPYGGNFWDDLSNQSKPIVDEKSGENHTIPGPDGIGDTAYVVDSIDVTNENNRDECPLMNPYGSVRPPALHVYDTCKVVTGPRGTATTNCPIAVYSDSNVTNFSFNKSAGLISFNVSGGTFSKVIVSREILDGVFEVAVDDKPAASFLNCEGDYVFANFTYASGSYKVEIQGEMTATILGDLNQDGRVDIKDAAIFGKNYGNTLQNP